MTFSVPWMRAGDLTLTLGVALDPVSVTASVLVFVVSAFILVYSLAYLGPGEGRARFFATMAFFIAAMLLLVLAGSLLTLFIAWELVGVASYLLIGHRRGDAAASHAATKAFLTTRTADLAYLAAVALTVVVTGSDALDAPLRAGPLLPLIAALFLVGALGKSAQLPFSAWLPDAMRGPTPVSALLHSATMVAAGAYLLVRLFPVFQASGLLSAIALVGLVTALFASLAALAQTDLKRVLAYSTIAQLAEMVAAVGLGVPLAAFLLLIAHAFFKSSLFLAAGEIEHAVGSTEMSRARAHRLGALPRIAFVISGLALVGIPVSIAPSPRDAVLAAGLEAGILQAAALLAIAVLTGAYVARAYRLTFTTTGRSSSSQLLLSGPAIGLALAVVVFGLATSPLLGAPISHWLEATLGAAPETLAASALGITAGVLGMALGWRWPDLTPRLVPAASRGLGLDRAMVAVARAGTGLAALLARFDARMFDRAALRAADAAIALRSILDGLERRGFERAAMRLATQFVAMRVRLDLIERRGFDAFASSLSSRAVDLFVGNARLDRRLVDAAFDRGAELIALGSQRGRRIQTGLLESYLVAIGVWVLALAGIASVALVVAAR